MIQFIPYHALSPELSRELNEFIAEEFGHVPFVQQQIWAKPDWTVLLEAGGEVATFCNIIVREVIMDGQRRSVAGINNVITPAAHRGKGYSSRVLRETSTFLFEHLHAELGLLLCADALVPFYERLGWYTVECQLVYDQPNGREEYDSNVMLLTNGHNASLAPRYIDLNGLPW
ncbi:GNAT family N-acetyltransferase [uncultured Pontibacter sp.]|uniref:GNAT family N-acetyltransferase n=1 Tax=uncultured Pontibacter sp. TaxID=453356 RepID=UPI0026231316|nr:GNAT family N-acetyltransferase [uncultured Pontibacter sp.]